MLRWQQVAGRSLPRVERSVDQVIDSLEMAEQAAHAAQKDRNWQTEPLADLVAHIKNTHHKYTREEMARLVPLLEKVCSVHGKNHPELQQVRATFRAWSRN